MRANYWLLGLCCFCLVAPFGPNRVIHTLKAFFLARNTIVYFLFVSYLLFERLIAD